jgi:hypothetical protein
MANSAVITLAILGGGLMATGAVVSVAHHAERRQCMAAHAGDPQASEICSTGSGHGGGGHGGSSTGSDRNASSSSEAGGSARGGFGGDMAAEAAENDASPPLRPQA